MWRRLRLQGAELCLEELCLEEREGKLRRADQGDVRPARSDEAGLVLEVVLELGQEAVAPAQLVEVEEER